MVLDYGLDCLDNQFRAHFHEPVMNIPHILILSDKALLPEHDSSGVHSLVNHEGGHTGSLLSIDDSPVDRGGTTVLRQKGCMEVECSQTRNLPDNFRQHTEGHDHEEIRFPCFQGVEELRVLQRNRLEDRDIVLHGVFLDGAFIHLQAPSAGLVGNRHDSDNLKAVAYELVQRRHSKLRSTHIYDSCFLEKAHNLDFYLSPRALECIHIDY